MVALKIGAGSCPLSAHSGWDPFTLSVPLNLDFWHSTLAASMRVQRHLGSTPRPRASSQVPQALPFLPPCWSCQAESQAGWVWEELPAELLEGGEKLLDTGRGAACKFSEFLGYPSNVLAPLQHPVQIPGHTHAPQQGTYTPHTRLYMT